MQQITWRMNIGLDLTLSIVFFIFQVAFFDRLFTFSNDLAGWNQEFMYVIFFAYAIINFLSGAFFDSIEEFFRQVHHGKIDGHLVRPVPILSTMILRWCNPIKAILAVIIGIVGHNIYLLNLSPSLEKIILFWFAIALSVAANIGFFLILHLPTLMLGRVPPADYIQSEIRQMSMLPIGILPPKAIALTLTLLPISCGASVAGHAFRFGIDFVIGLFVLGVSALVMLTFFLSRISLRRWDSFGG
ncbi:ABC-2 family transporter protein [Trinickia sp.]|uniref:ABC-2 family transporter protein n=1 Tax=Trinickia sp. TaxID=2571163 RepID=UPI003F81E055